MTIVREPRRALGTMVTDGFVPLGLANDLKIAQSLGAQVVEILPNWRSLPDPKLLAREVRDAGLAIHSAHGSWGGQAIQATSVDLASIDPRRQSDSIDDLKRCLDWLAKAAGACLIVHPGGLSAAHDLDARRAALAHSLLSLADHASSSQIILCIENMPPGVHPGSHMLDLVALVKELNRPELALALDTGHANLSSTPSIETQNAGHLLHTTHVHDNNGKQDSHLPPGLGTIDWHAWSSSLNQINYRGPIMLECIRHLRDYPETLTPRLSKLLNSLTTMSPS